MHNKDSIENSIVVRLWNEFYRKMDRLEMLLMHYQRSILGDITNIFEGKAKCRYCNGIPFQIDEEKSIQNQMELEDVDCKDAEDIEACIRKLAKYYFRICLECESGATDWVSGATFSDEIEFKIISINGALIKPAEQLFNEIISFSKNFENHHTLLSHKPKNKKFHGVYSKLQKYLSSE